MYSNGMPWHPNELPTGEVRFVCVAAIDLGDGREGVCGGTYGACGKNHLQRPLSFRQRVASGEHANAGNPSWQDGMYGRDKHPYATNRLGDVARFI
jgi:hypothetical protein